MIIVQGIIAAIQFFAGGSLGGVFSPSVERVGSYELMRASGVLNGPNGLAVIMVINLPVVVALALIEERRGVRLLYAAAIFAALLGVYAVQTRSSWIALPIPLLVVVLALSGRRLWSLRGTCIVTIAAIALIGAAAAVGPGMAKRLTGPDGGSAESRIPMALGALHLIEQFPLLGVGINNYADALARHDRQGFSREFQHGNGVVHNMYLWSWAETGTIGLLAVLWYFGAAFCQAAKAWRGSADRRERALALGLAMGLLGIMIQGLFDIGFRVENSFTMVAAQIGLIAALPFASRPARAAAPRGAAPFELGGGAPRPRLSGAAVGRAT
jgi:O-antigen ligase